VIKHNFEHLQETKDLFDHLRKTKDLFDHLRETKDLGVNCHPDGGRAVVGAPAFMRGKERVLAPSALALAMDHPLTATRSTNRKLFSRRIKNPRTIQFPAANPPSVTRLAQAAPCHE